MRYQNSYYQPNNQLQALIAALIMAQRQEQQQQSQAQQRKPDAGEVAQDVAEGVAEKYGKDKVWDIVSDYFAGDAASSATPASQAAWNSGAGAASQAAWNAGANAATGTSGLGALVNTGAAVGNTGMTSFGSAAAAEAAGYVPVATGANGGVIAAAPGTGAEVAGESMLGSYAPYLGIPALAYGGWQLSEGMQADTKKQGTQQGALGGLGMGAGIAALAGLGPVGWAAALALGLGAGGGLGNIAASGKGEDQHARDNWRGYSRHEGLVDDDYNFTFDDGTRFSIGKGDDLENVGTENVWDPDNEWATENIADRGNRKIFQIDPTDPRAHELTALVSPLAEILEDRYAGQYSRDDVFEGDIAGTLYNSLATTGGDSVSKARQLYEGLGQFGGKNDILKALEQDQDLNDWERIVTGGTVDRIYGGGGNGPNRGEGWIHPLHREAYIAQAKAGGATGPVLDEEGFIIDENDPTFQYQHGRGVKVPDPFSGISAPQPQQQPQPTSHSLGPAPANAESLPWSDDIDPGFHLNNRIQEITGNRPPGWMEDLPPAEQLLSDVNKLPDNQIDPGFGSSWVELDPNAKVPDRPLVNMPRPTAGAGWRPTPSPELAEAASQAAQPALAPANKSNPFGGMSQAAAFKAVNDLAQAGKIGHDQHVAFNNKLNNMYGQEYHGDFSGVRGPSRTVDVAKFFGV